jgi:hypothetical protein
VLHFASMLRVPPQLVSVFQVGFNREKEENLTDET